MNLPNFLYNPFGNNYNPYYEDLLKHGAKRSVCFAEGDGGAGGGSGGEAGGEAGGGSGGGDGSDDWNVTLSGDNSGKSGEDGGSSGDGAGAGGDDDSDDGTGGGSGDGGKKPDADAGADDDSFDLDKVEVADGDVSEKMLAQVQNEDGTLNPVKVKGLLKSHKDLRAKVSILGEKAKGTSAPDEYKLPDALANNADLKEEGGVFQKMLAEMKEAGVSQAAADVVFSNIVAATEDKKTARIEDLQELYGDKAQETLNGLGKFYKKFTEGDKVLADGVLSTLRDGDASDVDLLNRIMQKFEGQVLPSAGAAVASSQPATVEAVDAEVDKACAKYEGDLQNPQLLEELERLDNLRHRIIEES